ncbi:hypothetical protein L211DRAFT_869647 [Terfezia boudieri ATCC MYA-4762]|uniref:Uncharacterized protein n=1 Tax=Terfezia boudieri ATCC MYA-4762 TaxID=1051890 RepID=A0A3N4LGG9_9PEZI|nr:hypothetical protein L211DRAFT_869647 [Terfezia boudieri ATCC MYA-4762]
MATASNAASTPRTVGLSKKVSFAISMEEYWTKVLGLVVNNVAGNTHTPGHTQVIRGLGWLAGGLENLGHIEEGLFPSFQTFANLGLLPLPISAATQTSPPRQRKELVPGGKKREVKKDTVASSSGKKGESKKPASSGTKGESKKPASSGSKGESKKPASSGSKGESKKPASSGKKGESKEPATSGDTGKGKRKKSVSSGGENKDRKGKGRAKEEESGAEGQVKKQGGKGKGKKPVGKGKKPAKGGGEREPGPPLPPRPLVGLEGTAIVIHAVPTYRRLSDLLTKLLFEPKDTEIKSLRWLLPASKRAGKKASSLVLYLNTEEVPEDLVLIPVHFLISGSLYPFFLYIPLSGHCSQRTAIGVLCCLLCTTIPQPNLPLELSSLSIHIGMDPRLPWGRDQPPSPGSFSHLPPLPSSLEVASVANGSNSNVSSATPRPLVVSNPTSQTPSVSLPAGRSVASSHTLTHSVAVAMLEGRPRPSNGRRMSISDPTTPALRSLPIRNRLRRYTSAGPAPLPEQQLPGEAADVSPGTLVNSQKHRLAYSQLRYQARTQTQPEARPVSRPLSPAPATTLNEHTTNQLQARRIYSGAGIPGAGVFSSHSRSTSLSTHLEDLEGGLLAPPNSRMSSILRPTSTTSLDEDILGTSRPPARMRSSSAWYIPQNLERLNNTPNQHQRRVSFATVDHTIQNQRRVSLATVNNPVQNQRRVSFATIDIDIPSNAPPPIPPRPSFDFGARKSSESVASDAERIRRRSSVMSSSLLAIQLDPTRRLTTMGQEIRPTPVSMVGYDGEGYEAETENKAPLLSMRKSRRRSSGAIPIPDNREVAKAGASPNMHSWGLRVHSRNLSKAQPYVPAEAGHLPEAVKRGPVFVSSPREITISANGNNITKVSPNNPVSAATTQIIHFQEEGSSPQVLPIDEIDSRELTSSTAIATATAILSSITITRSASTSSFSTLIPEVFTFKKFTPGHFPENIDGITSCGSQGSSPARTIIRRNSWMRDSYDQDGDHSSSPVEKILGQGGIGCNAAYVPAENEEQGEHDNSGYAGTISKTTTRNKGKSRAIDFGSGDEEHAYITVIANSRNRMVSATSTSTVIRVDHDFTDNSIKTHKHRPKKQKGKQGTAAISCAPPGNTTFNFPSNDRDFQLPVSFSPPSNTQGLDLNAHNLHEHATSEHLLDLPEVRELTQFTTQLPTLDQIRGYETFDSLNADIGGDNPDEEVGFFKTAVHVIGVYFCYCFMTRKKKRVKKTYSGGRTTPLLEEGSEYSSGEERVSNSERRAKMKTYGTLIERNFSGPAPARSSIDLLIPIGTYGHKPNHFTGTPSGNSLEGEIKPAEDEDVPTRWVYHPAYEVDIEDAGDYAYLSEGSASDATSVWRGHVRYRELLAAQKAQREEARLCCTSQKAGKRQHRGRLQRDKKRVVSAATISGSILSVSTAPLFVGSNRSESEHAEKADSEFDGGDEADTAYTGDGATHSESIIGETSDESEDWESRSAGSAWSFPDCGSFKQSHIHTIPAAPPRDIYSTISSVGSFCSNYFAGPIARRPSSIYNTVTKPCLSATLAPNGGTSFPAGKDGEGHGYLVQELRSVLRNGVNACDSWGKSVYPEGLPEGSMSSRATSYGSYLASTAGGAKGCFETNIRDFGATSTSSPLLPPVSSRKASRQPFSVIEVDTSIETYMHQKPPSVYRSAPESLKFHLENMKQAEVRAKVKKECKAGRGKLEGFYPEVVDGKKRALVKDFDGEKDSDVEEELECGD